MKKIILLLSLTIVLAACSEDEPEYTNPYNTANQYLELWHEQDFQTMYDELLLQRATAEFSEEDYVERYKHLYDVLNVQDLSIEIVEEQEELTQEDLKTLRNIDIPIKISFQTLAGEIEYKKDLHLEKFVEEEYAGESERELDPESPWYVNWDPSFILPKLEKGDEVRYSTIPANRGDIVDRNGNYLATEGEVYEVGIVPQDFDEGNISKLANILDVSEDFINDKLNQSWVQPNQLVPIKKLSLDDEGLMTRAIAIEGVTSDYTMDRVYNYGEAAAHLTGYIGSITAEELEEHEDKGYTAQDVIGKRGLEQLYEEELRGENGVELYIVKPNSSTQTIAKKDPVNGQTIELTIDMNLQQQIYDTLKDEAGTAVTINPKTGEVTSLISYPSFDPNNYVLGFKQSEYEALTDDDRNPTLNRFSTTFSPGSSIKPISATVGLSHGDLNPTETKEIVGKSWSKDDSWGNYSVTRVYDQDQAVDLESAMVNSDNIYFAMMATDMGAQSFKEGLTHVGFGEEMPFEYPIVDSQISNSGDFESEIQLADSGYGQGQMLMNIVHLASLYGGIVNDGTVMKPLLKSEESSTAWIEDMASPEDAQLIQELLRKVVTEGTANSINISGHEIAGKTGTAELKATRDEEGSENGLFVSYDQQNPEFILAIMVEGVEDKGGSGFVVDLAKQIYQNR
ncbi:penicillin-binding transpeptidase domain-containing protein [Piscibacillus sp. B03]|uniref:penicillin-binding transpeptidase domain-containing protein n=1 Tax=Piscibacillus sp. B03 TaxID=3457430 RepID=UPI003FCE10DC